MSLSASQRPQTFQESVATRRTQSARLLDGVAAACKRLVPTGWGDLLSQHGLDLGATDLAGELARELKGIDRTQPGFEDFACEAVRAIEPGRPSHSLLFHALASPEVRRF